jgi:hypothetical protein
MTTPILQLDEWEAGQSQPHVTINEALRWLECFTQLSAIDIANAPPGSASDGDCYIVGPAATGDFAGHENQVALYLGTAWAFRTAPPGSIAYIQDEAQHRYYDIDVSPITWTVL